MKLGDLVTMPGTWIRNMDDGNGLGMVVELPFVGPNGETQQTPRVGILWSDGEGIDWEPETWLEVISESR